MIANILLTIVSALISYVAQALPVATPLPPGASEWVSYFVSGVELVGFLLPMQTIGTVASLAFAIYGFLIAYKVAMALFKMFRG